MAEQKLLGGRRKGGPFLFYLLLMLVGSAMGLAVYAYFFGSERVMPWQPQAELYPVTITLTKFTHLFQTFRIPVSGFALSERFDVGLPVIDTLPAVLYLGILGIALAVYFTVVSTFSRLPYIAAMTLGMLFIATFNVDLLRVTKEDSQWFLILILGVLVLVSYGFQAFFTRASLWVRFVVLATILLALAGYIFRASQYTPSLSAMQIISYNSLGSFVAASLFIFLVSFENIHALLWLNTQGANPQRRQGLWHFGLIGTLYLLNLLLIYLKNAGLIELDFYYVDAFIILLVSTVAGYWGWKRRELHYHTYFTFKHGASYLYLVLAIVCFLSIGYAFATANTPQIAAFTDVIIYTHLAYGFLFFLYVIVNFWKLIKERLAVYKVVFDPKLMPFFTVYIMGTLLLMSLTFRTNFNFYRLAQAGYYNFLGDFYKAAGNPLLAERFYTEGTVFSHHNLKSTYALAGIYRERTYQNAEINLLKDALAGKPNEKIYTRMAATQTDKKDFFNHLFLLNQGLRAFPQSTALLNNKALLYETTTLSDSTEYFYQQALATANDHETLLQSNRLAFYIKNGLPQPAVKLAQETPKQANYPAWQSNTALLALLREETKPANSPIVLPGKVLSPAQFSLFYHHTLQTIAQANAATLKQIDLYLKEPGNAPYAENLTLLKGLAEFKAGQIHAARNTLENQALVSEVTAGLDYYIIGSWLLEQQLYEAAASYFEKAKNARTPEAELPYLYALAHTTHKNEALSAALLATKELNDPNEKAQASFLANVLNLTNASVLSASDSAKVAYLALYQKELSTAEFETVAGAVQSMPQQLLAKRELAAHYLRTNQLAAADKTIKTALPAARKNKTIITDFNLLQADLFLKQGNVAGLKSLLPTLAGNATTRNQRLFYEAWVTEHSQQKQQAVRWYQNIPQSLIYNEDALLSAAGYYSQVKKNDDKAYAILLSGIKYNPFSVPLYKAYIFTSIKLGFIDFAETATNELKNLLAPAEYTAFRVDYEQKLKEKQAFVPGWD